MAIRIERLVHQTRRFTTHRTGAAIALLTITLVSAAAAAQGNVDLPRFPSMSPDGEHITFTWRGDIWKVSSDGGNAMRLTSHPADDIRTAWSPDGERIAFTSDRDGYMNIWIMNADGSNVERVSNLDRPCALEAFGVDDNGNTVVTFSTTLEADVYRSERPYMINLDGGEPMRIHDAFGSQPRIADDGERVLFVRGGYYSGFERRHSRGPETMELWLYDRSADAFTRLTDWTGHDGNPRWADDDTVLFMSERNDVDTVNLYALDLSRDNAKPKRLTRMRDHDIQHFDVSADGSKAVLLSWDTLYTLELDRSGARPKPLTINAAEDLRDNYKIQSVDREVSEAALSPDGKVMAYVSYGEVYVRNIEDKSPTQRVTEDVARDRHIAWSPDGLKLYFSSDRDGTESIYAATVKLTRSEIKQQFEDEEVKAKREGPDPTGVWTGVFEDPDAGEIDFTIEIKVSRTNKVSGSVDAGVYSGDISGTFDPRTGSLKLELSGENLEEPITVLLKLMDGTLIGTAVSGDVVIPINAARDEDAKLDDDNGADEANDEDKQYDPSRWHDAVAFNIAPVVQTRHHDRNPKLSPDGTYLSFQRQRGSLMLLNLDTGEQRELFEHWDWWLQWTWAPDSRHVAVSRANMNFNNDIFIMPVEGDSEAEAVNITRHPDNDVNPRFSADGKILSFVSERINEEFDVWMVYLDEDLEALTPKELEAYYSDAVKAAGKRKPLEVELPDDEEDDNGDDEEDAEEAEDEDAEAPWTLEELSDAYRRVQRLTRMSGSETDLAMTPGGDRFVFNGSYGGSGLYSIKWDGSDRKRIHGTADVQHVTLAGDKVVLVDRGTAMTIPPAGGKAESINIDDEIRIDLASQASQMFHEAARVLGLMFYHPDMKGRDWDALTERYHDLAVRTRTADEFTYVLNHLFGELTASHLGAYASGYNSPNRQAHGRLGTVTERIELDNGRIGFEVLEVIPESPASKGPMALEEGDIITAIELEPFDENDTIAARLEGMVGEEVVVTIEREVDGETRDYNVLITPTSFGAFRQLRYRAWRQHNADLVEKWSDGRLGYIHIQGMNQPSLDVFERDLFAAADGKDGLVVDVRNNGGGWTTDRVLSSIMVREHAYTVPRGAPHVTGHYPQDRLFIQRYTMPMNALCNEKSFSNAEIFSHAFKTLERGTLVGEETWGGVISTGGFGLLNGTFVRLPFRGWYVVGGTDMENQGAVPDIRIEKTPESEVAGDDEQLRAAVDDLLERLD